MSNVCAFCGKEFEPVDKWHPNQQYCSKECRQSVVVRKARPQRTTEQRREYARRYAAEHVEQRNKYYIQKFVRPESTAVDPLNIPLRRLNGENLCMWCGYEFEPVQKNQRFCCDEHAARFYAKLFNNRDEFGL